MSETLRRDIPSLLWDTSVLRFYEHSAAPLKAVRMNPMQLLRLVPNRTEHLPLSMFESLVSPTKIFHTVEDIESSPVHVRFLGDSSTLSVRRMRCVREQLKSVTSFKINFLELPKEGLNLSDSAPISYITAPPKAS
jgi:hypothetical protein